MAPHHFRAALLALAVSGAACAEIGTGTNMDSPSFEEFAEDTYLEPFEHGVYIVNGDTPIENDKKLYEYWQMLYGPDALIVHRSGGLDAAWNSTQKNNLTYCVSNSFGNHKSQVIAAIEAAGNQWEAAADIDFIHVPSQDGNCRATNNSVVFDVRPTSGASYLARAFFPNQGRSSRNVIIDSSAYNTVWSLENILAHELGHALGFRHEHTRPEAGTCFEDSSWRPLTPYDSSSIMHYPQCNGSDNDLTMTATDRVGAAALYGSPGGGGGGGGDGGGGGGGDGGGGGTPSTGSDGPRSISRGQQITYQPIDVVGGSRFDASITGTGDADLYVQFGSAPTLSLWDCRPYIDGSNESCSLDVPAGEDQAYIMVRGYQAATYTLSASWMAP